MNETTVLSASFSTAFVWAGIALCLSQSALFSGLNIAVFSISRLRLEVEAASGNSGAQRVLALRQRSNHVLTTILWGNVAINVLLAMLSDSVLSGVSAFLFSTIVITLLGEIAPQAYFCRNALRIAARLTPVLRFYLWVLYPVAKPTSMILDRWLGQEGLTYYRERDLREVIRKHIDSDEGDIDRLEGMGALNFLEIDDIAVHQEGTRIDENSIVALPFSEDSKVTGKAMPVFPAFTRTPDDPFLRRLHASRRHWVVLTDLSGEPRLVLDADGFLRAALLESGPADPVDFAYCPYVVREPHTLLGTVLARLESPPLKPGPRTVDIVLVWTDPPRLISGDDILRRLLKGVTTQKSKRD